MLENYVGEDAWREGVRAYMKKHAYGNTVSADLWSAVQSAAGKPIQDIARDFTTQPGIPLITVESATCRGGNTTLQLSQGEFTKDRPGKAPLHWRVPVVAATAGGVRVDTVVENGKGTLQVPGCGAVVVNAGQAGYYRTVYDRAQFAAIGRDFAKLDPIDQLGIMNDTWALGMAGLRPASDYLDLAKGMSVDADPAIWAELKASDKPIRATAYPVSKVVIGANLAFTQAAPQLTSFFKNYGISSALTSQMLGEARKAGITPEEQALRFLKDRPDDWRHWVTAEVAAKVQAGL